MSLPPGADPVNMTYRLRHPLIPGLYVTMPYFTPAQPLTWDDAYIGLVARLAPTLSFTTISFASHVERLANAGQAFPDALDDTLRERLYSVLLYQQFQRAAFRVLGRYWDLAPELPGWVRTKQAALA